MDGLRTVFEPYGAPLLFHKRHILAAIVVIGGPSRRIYTQTEDFSSAIPPSPGQWTRTPRNNELAMPHNNDVGTRYSAYQHECHGNKGKEP